jgi:hypothetical protein
VCVCVEFEVIFGYSEDLMQCDSMVLVDRHSTGSWEQSASSVVKVGDKKDGTTYR